MSLPDPSFHVVLRGDQDTQRCAETVADVLRTGDVLLLEGPVGAGKTAFSRAIIQTIQAQDGAGIEDVPSPTFTLVQTYQTSRFEIWHADLYRLSSPDEVIELGLDLAFEAAVCLVEWPDRLGTDIPDGACSLTFDMQGDDARCLRIDASNLGQRLAGALTGWSPTPTESS